MAISTVKSRTYYFEGPNKEFHTQNAAQRQAEWAQKAMRETFGDRYIGSKLHWTSESVQVVMKIKS